MSWKTPTGASGAAWDNPPSYPIENCYDGNTSSYVREAASGNDWTDYLEIEYSGGLDCSKCRIYVHSDTKKASFTKIEVSFYYGGDWHKVYEGSFNEGQYDTYWSAKIANVTKVRLRFYNNAPASQGWACVSEVEFWEVEPVAVGYDNAVGFYRCEEESGTTVADASGNDNDVTASRDTSNLTASGKINNGFDMNRSDKDYLNLDVLNSILGSSDRSIFLWYNSTYSANWCAIVGINSSGGGSNKFLLNQGASGVGYKLRASGDGTGSVGPINDGEWHLVGYTYKSSTNQVTLWCDGVRGDQYTYNPSFTSDDIIAIGGEYDSGPVISDCIDAIIDNIMVFDDVLGQAEIAWLYNNGKGRNRPGGSGRPLVGCGLTSGRKGLVL